ncbi:gamma-aminobutyric acid receptor subunit beta-like [Gigantopelta aegis]|uniref:gamma-aminobutyric acid receptor subunit beta-like n=1 Tax=Gigantopelta aegis TaxID=1735272 RepID=UPI001B888B08|nr:gamma-aminobutyric acid receptor subunit beta-like [Gigantopelta aegis]
MSFVTDTIRRLLDGYDIRLRPSFGESALKIGIEVIVASFDSISEVNMDYTITMYLNQYWSDDRLKFSDEPNHSMTLTGDFTDRIWVPDTFLANDKNSYLHDVTEKNKMIRLYGNGSIVYGMRFTTTLACMMDLHNYPLDQQRCSVEIESYGYAESDVDLHWLEQNSVSGVEHVQLPQFSIVDYSTVVWVERLLTGNYKRLSLHFKLRRNIGYFIFQTYLPSILIVMLSWVSFWINHEATSARVALGITTVLTMTTINNGVRSSLPRISYVKAIDIYLVMCFVFVFAALLEYAAVNYTYWGARAKRKAKRMRERSFRQKNNDTENTNNYDSMEMKGVHMSPVLGIRNNQSFNPDIESGQGETSNLHSPPSLPRTYVSHGYLPHTMIRRRNSASQPKRKRLFSNFKQKAKTIRVRFPRVQDVNTIDKYSRLLFPLLFLLFNATYWVVYLLAPYHESQKN